MSCFSDKVETNIAVSIAFICTLLPLFLSKNIVIDEPDTQDTQSLTLYLPKGYINDMGIISSVCPYKRRVSSTYCVCSPCHSSNFSYLVLTNCMGGGYMGECKNKLTT